MLECNAHSSEAEFFIKKSIQEFFHEILINIEQNLSKVLEKDDTKILLIIDREELVISNDILESKNIVAAIIFGVHNQFGTVIDYLAVHASKQYNSLGPILLNLSQLYSSIL